MSRAAAKLTLSVLAMLALPGLAAEYVVTADSIRSNNGSFIFTGAVAIESDELELAADELTVQNDTYQLSGSPARLILNKDGVATVASGKIISYDSLRERLEVTGDGSLLQNDLEIWAGTIKFNLHGQHLQAAGAVRLRGHELSANGDSATSSGSNDKLVFVMTGSPARLEIASVDGQELNASASRIEITQLEGLVEMNGDAQAIVGQQSVSGDVIKYDLEHSTFVALPDKGGRVRAVIKTQ